MCHQWISKPMPNDKIGFAAPGYSTKRHALFFYFIFWVKVSFHPFYPRQQVFSETDFVWRNTKKTSLDWPTTRVRNIKKLTHNSTPEVMMNKWKILRWENFGWNFILQNIYPWKIFTPKNVPPKNIFTPVKDSPLKSIHLWKIFIAKKYSPLTYI